MFVFFLSNPDDRRKFSDKSRFPNGQIAPQTAEEYYCRNFGEWFQKATKKFYIDMKLELMKKEDIPKYAGKISEFQKRDKVIQKLFFTVPDIEEEDWHVIVDRCCQEMFDDCHFHTEFQVFVDIVLLNESKDKVMADLYKKYGLPMDILDDTRHGVEEDSYLFVSEHYSFGSIGVLSQLFKF